jgi:hypothetical protein
MGMSTDRQLVAIHAESPIGHVTWTPSGWMHVGAPIGPGPTPGDELARRDARLAEALRRALGSSPYGPVTRDPSLATRSLADALGVAPRREYGEHTSCRCIQTESARGETAIEYAERHLEYLGQASQDDCWDCQTFRCDETATRWLLSYVGSHLEPQLSRMVRDGRSSRDMGGR